jgi:hypothetical protein
VGRDVCRGRALNGPPGCARGRDFAYARSSALSVLRHLQVLDQAPSSAGSSDRDRTITRLSVLKSAASFLGAMAQVHEEVRSDHVLVLADKWLAWVEQEGGEQAD